MLFATTGLNSDGQAMADWHEAALYAFSVSRVMKPMISTCSEQGRTIRTARYEAVAVVRSQGQGGLRYSASIDG